MLRSLITSLLCIGLLGSLDADPTNDSPEKPWLTGPLLTPSGTTTEKGHIDMEPYLFYIVQTGVYDKGGHPVDLQTEYTLSPQLYIWIGLTKSIDFTLALLWIDSWRGNQSYRGLSDTTLGFDIQIVTESPKCWYPSIKATIQELFPTGNYDGFRLLGLGTDLTGLGAYITFFSCVFSKLTHFYDDYFLSSELSLSIALPTSINVRGINTYGGGPDTKGAVEPGASFFAFLGNELTLSKNWALALDVAYRYAERVDFHGTTTLPVGYPSLIQWSLAPAIEYNWSENGGVIVGSWFTVAGRNSGRFVNGVAAVNFYF